MRQARCLAFNIISGLSLWFPERSTQKSGSKPKLRWHSSNNWTPHNPNDPPLSPAHTEKQQYLPSGEDKCQCVRCDCQGGCRTNFIGRQVSCRKFEEFLGVYDVGTSVPKRFGRLPGFSYICRLARLGW